MKQILKGTLFVLTSLLLLPLTASADAVEVDGIYYNLVNKTKTAEVAAHPSKYSGDITIPESIIYDDNNYTVNKIGDSSFKNCYSLTNVHLPETIREIGSWGFDGCNSLETINIPDGVTSIGGSAFKDCTKLSSIIFPHGITEIRGLSFRNCSSLTSISIPDNVTSIGERAFMGCSGLISVKMSSNLDDVSAGVFQNCTKLKQIEIPNSLSDIGPYMFSGCTGLASISFHGNLQNIYQNAFQGCTNLISVNIPNSVTFISYNAFKDCTNLTTIAIGTGIDNIDSNCFANCNELSDVYCFAESISFTSSDTFDGSYVNLAKLHVPAASVSSYSSSAPWSGFGEIVPITSEDIAIGDLGIGTFCGSNPLDLSGTEDVKAYVVSSYESATGQVTLTRTYYIPPFTGVVVKGNKGVHTIPAGVGQPVYPNMMKGVTTNTALAKVNGDYTNYVLANKGGNLGFYAVSDGSTLGAGKAYLPLPTADLPSSSARGLILNFDDEDVTAINSAKIQQSVENGQYYDLQGRRVDNPTSGLYIVNGKKVIIK
jgi:hypothetical protein